MIGSLRMKLLELSVPIAKASSKIHAPYNRKLIKAKDYHTIRDLISPGMFLLSVTKGEISNVLIPGFWSHGGMYVGEDKVVEATCSHGVIESDILDFIFSKDYISLTELNKSNVFKLDGI